MKLKKWLKHVDPVINVRIFTDKSPDDKPAFDGALFDIPKKYKNMEIGRPKSDKSKDEPIFIVTFVNGYKVTLPLIVINLLEK